jgi:hypothetical protein
MESEFFLRYQQFADDMIAQAHEPVDNELAYAVKGDEFYSLFVYIFTFFRYSR